MIFSWKSGGRSRHRRGQKVPSQLSHQPRNPSRGSLRSSQLEKEKSKLLSSLQSAQGMQGGGGDAAAVSNGSANGGDAKLLATIEKLKKKVEKLETKKSAPAGPPPGGPPPPSGPPPPAAAAASDKSAELEAAKAENASLKDKCEEVRRLIKVKSSLRAGH